MIFYQLLPCILPWFTFHSGKQLTFKGRVYCLASDGEMRCGKALASLTECVHLSPSSTIYPFLQNLSLLNLMVRDDDITLNKDYKHVLKCFQHAHLCPNGVSIAYIIITPSILHSHLLPPIYSTHIITNP